MFKAHKYYFTQTEREATAITCNNGNIHICLPYIFSIQELIIVLAHEHLHKALIPLGLTGKQEHYAMQLMWCN